MLFKVARSFARKVNKPDKLPFGVKPKPKVEFPKELQKAGISKKDMNEETLRIYKNLKEKGADKYINKVMPPEKLFEGLEDLEEEEPPKPPIQPQLTQEDIEMGSINIPKEDRERISYQIKQTEVASHINEERSKLREVVRKDIKKSKGADSSSGEEEEDEELEIYPNKHPNFQNMISELSEGDKKHFYQKIQKENAQIRKARKELEKVQQKRTIRDAYKEFSIKTEKPKTVDVYLETAKKNIHRGLSDLMNKNKQVLREEILEGGYIQIHKVEVNRSMSLVHAFFEGFFPDLIVQNDEEEINRRNEMIKRKLTHSIPYFRGKLVQEVGLKYAPELRFIYYRLGDTSEQYTRGPESLQKIGDFLSTAEPEEIELVTKPVLPPKKPKKKHYKKK
mgnify:FL=1